MDMKIVVIGDENGINDVLRSIKYPQLIAAKYIYDRNFFSTVPSNFLDDIEIVIVAFELVSLKVKICNIINSYHNGQGVMLIDFYYLRKFSSPYIIADKTMNNPYVDSYNGLILGISHAEVGIIPSRLTGNFANLAISAQDIYYDYKNLEYCLTKYPGKLSKLDTVIIDMFDYSYFNLDASVTNGIIKYLASGGVDIDKHNFDQNIDIKDVSFEDIIRSIRNEFQPPENNETYSVWEMLFYTDLERLYGKEYSPAYDQLYRFEIVSDENMDEFHLGRFMEQRFEKTLEENILYFDKILEELYKINPDMKIYLTLLPRFQGVWEKEEEMRELWKDYFYSVLEKVKEKYDFKVLDYSRNEIAMTRAFYFDSSHFNFLGAIKFTDMLNADIFADKNQ